MVDYEAINKQNPRLEEEQELLNKIDELGWFVSGYSTSAELIPSNSAACIADYTLTLQLQPMPKPPGGESGGDA